MARDEDRGALPPGRRSTKVMDPALRRRSSQADADGALQDLLRLLPRPGRPGRPGRGRARTSAPSRAGRRGPKIADIFRTLTEGLDGHADAVVHQPAAVGPLRPGATTSAHFYKGGDRPGATRRTSRSCQGSTSWTNRRRSGARFPIEEAMRARWPKAGRRTTGAGAAAPAGRRRRLTRPHVAHGRSWTAALLELTKAPHHGLRGRSPWPPATSCSGSGLDVERAAAHAGRVPAGVRLGRPQPGPGGPASTRA